MVVLEKGYLCAGASGRNGGGIRAQWGTPTLISLARRSIELMKRFARDMGINVWFRQGGYLFLAKSDEVVKKHRAQRGAAQPARRAHADPHPRRGARGGARS